MNRRIFIKNSCMACLGLAAGANLLQGCAALTPVTGQLTDNGILVPLHHFVSARGYRSYVVVRHESLRYPVYVYRFNENLYTALYMRCSHQGAELQAAGDRLTCPAHGSEFDNKGQVRQGPAAEALRNFPTQLSGEHLFIDLRKQA